MGYTYGLLNGIALNVKSCTESRPQKRLKQVMGSSLSQISIIGMGDKQWELDLSCLVLGTTSANLDTNRAAIQALRDCGTYAFVDGLHDGTYIIVPESLIFSDTGENANTSYKFTVKLVQE